MIDPEAYWNERGPTYLAFLEGRFALYRDQERALRDVLGVLRFENVLEVGCGFGRIAALLREERPDAKYTGIDFSRSMVDEFARNLPDLKVLHTSLQDYSPGRRYDLVLAVEVLMHVPPEDVQDAVKKLFGLSARYVVTVDWTEPLPEGKEVDPMNWRHDYDALFPLGPGLFSWTLRVGLQSIRVLEF